MIFEKFFLGSDCYSYKYMGCHKKDKGIEFYLWAPHAEKIEVFISKDNYYNPFIMDKVDTRGIWHLFIDNTELIYSYFYRIYNGKSCVDKLDPYGFFTDLDDKKSFMYSYNSYMFNDDLYMKNRHFSYENPLNIYELHINGFKHDNGFTSYEQLKKDLIPYVKDMGYSHIEILPIFEHPFGGSWGYHATGFFSPTNRYGSPEGLQDFINECHKNNIGVILDVSYIQFAIDDYALKMFDGEACFEKNSDNVSKWGSYFFDLGKKEVLSFVISSANFFLEEYHFDGLRIDAVADLIYDDGTKDKGINKDGIEFLIKFNTIIKEAHPDCILIAEDSTDYPDVTKSYKEGGLGFDYKWDLGWMNDTLDYYALSPDKRDINHNLLTFSMGYFYKEKYLLPLSHDEVVHSKKTIVDKMYGAYEEKFSQCRNLFIYMFTHPGKKLNFLGNEIAMFREFDNDREIDWDILKYPIHDSFKRFFTDMCQIYKSYKAFYAFDYNPNSFKWIEPDNNKQSVYSYIRSDDSYYFIIVLNMKPISYNNYRIGVPLKGEYIELINSEKDIYNGCNMCNYEPIISSNIKAHGYDQSISIDLAPYAGIIFKVRK